jgi:hypothetical protein
MRGGGECVHYIIHNEFPEEYKYLLNSDWWWQWETVRMDTGMKYFATFPTCRAGQFTHYKERMFWQIFTEIAEEIIISFRSCSLCVQYVLYLICNARKIPCMYSYSGNCAASVPLNIHVSVSDLYISCSRIGRSIVGIYNRSQTYECGNCGNVAAQFLFWEYLFQFSVLCSGLGHDNSQWCRSSSAACFESFQNL